MAPSSACSASILCGGARNVGSAGVCLRAIESIAAMVPIRGFACGRFAVTQHRGSLYDGGTVWALATVDATTHVLSIVERGGNGKPSLRLSPLLTVRGRGIDT